MAERQSVSRDPGRRIPGKNRPPTIGIRAKIWWLRSAEPDKVAKNICRMQIAWPQDEGHKVSRQSACPGVSVQGLTSWHRAPCLPVRQTQQLARESPDHQKTYGRQTPAKPWLLARRQGKMPHSH